MVPNDSRFGLKRAEHALLFTEARAACADESPLATCYGGQSCRKQ